MTSSVNALMAAPQKRRPCVGAVMSGGLLGGFAGFASHVCDHTGLRLLLRTILRPEHDGEQERAHAHCDVRDVEGRPARVAETDVEEIHDTARTRTQAIDQVADG